MDFYALLPMKAHSERVNNKNIRTFYGKPLFYYSIDYAKDTKYNNRIIVSTESRRVQSLLPKGVELHERSIDLCGDVEVVDVYLDIVKDINDEFDYVICLQPDNPNRSNTLDECLDYLIENNYDDLITVNNEYKRSGSVRIFKYEYLKAGLVSKRMGCIRDDATDIHYKEDLEALYD